MASNSKSTRPPNQPLKVSLALQGGGTHAAFAWGALDQLLTDDSLQIEGISATGGGAIQAVALADGWLKGRNEGARAQLEKLWKKIALAGNMMPLKVNPFGKLLGEVGIDFAPTTMAMDYLTRLFSPYQFNLFDLNPLKGIVQEVADFDRIRAKPPFPIYINTTHVKSGRSRIFTASELSLEVVMASSCLPFLFKTVMINGEPYWDGAYSGNPLLTPLASETQTKNIVLIRSVAIQEEEVPTQASDILDRATEISFNTSLLYEMQALETHNQQHPKGKASLHVIEADEVIAGLGRASKLNTDSDFLNYLHDLGAQAMHDWMQKG